MKSPRPEILAPVGDWEMCLAAVHNGADAIYLGMPGFNARGRAKTFTLPELKSIIDFCHLYGVRVLLAFNVLIFERELKDAEAILREVLPLGPDALIVQDIGLVRLIKAIDPAQVVHASTQMTITSHEAIALTEDLEIQRYVLGRELSLSEIRKVKEHTPRELEVFVHGALCVAYSGQCLTSESMGGRSANRGQCAQSCRLEYELIVDGVPRNLGDRRHLVSPQDLCGLDEIQELCDIGISSFKIEGRLKSPEYVADTVRAYREQRDAAPHRSESISTDTLAIDYSRGFFSGWLHGVNHQRLVDGRYSNHHGLRAGSVRSIERGKVIVASSRAPQRGDGVLFADFKSRTEVGDFVYESHPCGESLYRLEFSNRFDVSRIRTGMEFFINASESSARATRRTFTDKSLLRRVPVIAHLSGSIGESATLELRDSEGRTVRASSTQKFAPAQNAPLSPDQIKEEISALSGTAFVIDSITCDIPSNVFMHRKELKELRRAAIEALEKERTLPRPRRIRSDAEVASWRENASAPPTFSAPTPPGLYALLRSSEQLPAVFDLPLAGVYLDYEFGKEYADSVRQLRDAGQKVGIATTRILKPGETGHLKVIERSQPDFVLIRNLGALHYFQDSSINLVGDFSLNVTNSLTAQWLLSKNLSAITPSYDLNEQQLLELISAVPHIPFELTLHQYMPTFHMEHCVFAAFLSNGTSYRDCGRPCEKHRVELRDRNGISHPLKPDAECRNTMYLGTPQSAARLATSTKERSITRFRVESLYESPTELRAKLETYLALVQGQISAQAAIARLGVHEKYGVTEGQLYNIRRWEDRKKDAPPPATFASR